MQFNFSSFSSQCFRMVMRFVLPPHDFVLTFIQIVIVVIVSHSFIVLLIRCWARIIAINFLTLAMPITSHGLYLNNSSLCF